MEEEMVGGELLSTVNMMRRHIYNNRMEVDDPQNHPTSTQEWFMVYIVQKGSSQNIFQKDLETQFNIRRSTATEILKAMERKDLIRREPLSEDKRAKRIILTEKGRRICEENRQRIQQIEDKLLQGFQEEEIRQLRQFLARMQKNME